MNIEKKITSSLILPHFSHVQKFVMYFQRWMTWMFQSGNVTWEKKCQVTFTPCSSSNGFIKASSAWSHQTNALSSCAVAAPAKSHIAVPPKRAFLNVVIIKLHCLFKLKWTTVINRTNFKLSVNNKIGLNMWIFGLLDPTAHKLDRCEIFFLKTRLLRCLCERHRCY